MIGMERKNYVSIFQCYKTLFAIDVSEYENGTARLSLPVVPALMIKDLCNQVSKIFAAESNVVRLSGNYVVVGDLHGHILDLFRIMKQFGLPARQQYIFLGDLVDRGEFSVETLLLILVMKFLWPDRIYVIRGNHEFAPLWRSNGFQREVDLMYPGSSVLSDFERVFSQIPLGAIVNDDYFCVHGGIGPEFLRIEQLEEIERPIYDFDFEPITSAVWSDPLTHGNGFKKSTRGSGSLFGEIQTKEFLKANNLKMIVRGHQCIQSGCDFIFDGTFATVFSASNYCGIAENQAGVLILSEDHSYNTVSFPSLKYIKRADSMFLYSASDRMFTLGPCSNQATARALPSLEHPRPNLRRVPAKITTTSPNLREAQEMMSSRRVATGRNLELSATKTRAHSHLASTQEFETGRTFIRIPAKGDTRRGKKDESKTPKRELRRPLTPQVLERKRFAD